MVVDPGTAMLIATAIATAAKGAGAHMANKKEEKAAKRRSRETKRETMAGLSNEAMNEAAELEAHHLRQKKNLGKSKAQSMQDTAGLVRGAINI